MLHPAIGRNRYCGPGAYAILTGQPTDVAAAALRSITGKRAIISTRPIDLCNALLRTGFWTIEIHTHARTLSALNELLLPVGRYLVMVTGHYVVIETFATGDMLVCDNKTVYPLPIERYTGRRKRIKHLWKVVPQ